MSVTPWSGLTLVTYSDLQDKEVGEGSKLFSLYDETYCGPVITEGKEQLLTDLTTDLPELFVSLNGYLVAYDIFRRQPGYSYTELDTMFDKIGNPDVLKSCARAKVINLLWIRLASEDQRDLNFNLGYGGEQAKEWDRLYKERYKKAKTQLYFDLNADGMVSDSERVRTKSSFKRG